MKVETTYYADDGKAFKNRWECEAYEDALAANKFKNTALLFDRCGNQLSLTAEGFQDSMFILCKDDSAAEYMFETFGPGYITPWGDYSKTVCASAGCWMYRGANDEEWIPADEILKDAEIIKDILKM